MPRKKTSRDGALGFAPLQPGGGTGGGVTFDGSISIGDIAKRTGANTLGKVTGIPASLIVDSQVLSGFSNTVIQAEIGATVNAVTLSWAYNRAPDPTSQSIDQGVGSLAVGLRSKALSALGLTSNTTWTISAVGDDGTNSALSTAVSFYPKRYWGVSQSVLDNSTSSAALLAALTQGSQLANTRAGTYSFDATPGGGNNYLYLFWPVSFGLPATSVFGGLAFSDYTVATKVGFTNAQGYSQDYYVFKTNNQYNGNSGLDWVIT